MQIAALKRQLTAIHEQERKIMIYRHEMRHYLQNIAYVDELGDYLKNFDEHGIFYCHDIESLHPDVYAVLKPQGTRSMLQCAILDEGEFAGYVGFDDCRENRAWNEKQVAAFKLTADVLSTFLMKLRLKHNEEKTR